MITISAAHHQARLAGTLAFIDTGTGEAQFRLYSSARVGITEPPTTTAVVSIPLAVPAGVVSGTGLALDQADDGLIMSTGQVLWTRLVNRNGDTVGDFDIRADADPVENGELSIPSTTLYAGGLARLTTANLT